MNLIICFFALMNFLIISQVFLDPLKKVKNMESVNSLISFCETHTQLCFFQALGMKLGINHWINNYKEMKSIGELGDHFMKSSIELSETTSSLAFSQHVSLLITMYLILLIMFGWFPWDHPWGKFIYIHTTCICTCTMTTLYCNIAGSHTVLYS